ncbi:hypothetical protein HELRODRAFT_164569 [Helobdella robusta]|uniref:Uncharacterized protein n=1 Tax=Helobdella robusta TaxID=6412 RepID=T1EVK8_HELRO|nr:hypothetical protein HELRODRAFT_164569 [Helobdella robusta]ESN94686.1 hypothetical protein HELRODRAFT_164569 [Helobdella robusta]
MGIESVVPSNYFTGSPDCGVDGKDEWSRHVVLSTLHWSMHALQKPCEQPARACIDQWRVKRTTCPLCRSPFHLTIYTSIRATREEVDYLKEQHFLCPFNEAPHHQVTYSPRVIEQFLNIMRCNVPIDQLFAPDKLMSAINKFMTTSSHGELELSK